MSKRYSVRAVNQQFSPVCWLACGAMIIQFKRGHTPSTTDLGMLGPDFRSPGLTVPDEAGTGPRQIATLRRLGFTFMRTSESSEAAIESLLVNHGPFILNHFVGSFWYGPVRGTVVPKKPSGHAVVITGIDTISHTVYFNNPWGDVDVPTTLSSILGAIERWERNPANFAIGYL